MEGCYLEDNARSIDSEKEKSERNSLLLELLKENWAHGRHVETERLSFISLYVVILGGMLAYLGEKFITENFNMQNMYPFFTFLLMFSFLGFSLSRKWGSVFDKHMMKIEKILNDLSSDNFKGLDYIVIPNYKSNNLKRTKHQFNGFYLIMIILWTSLLICSLSQKF